MISKSNDWRHLAEQASMETDPAKLLSLVTDLNEALEREETSRHILRKASST
jgi:hypothetical protein